MSEDAKEGPNPVRSDTQQGMVEEADADPVAEGPRVIAIIAMASNRIIGKDNDLPWRLPADLKLFRKHTMGYPIIMGRKTMASLPGLLPGRRNVVLTRSDAELPEGFERLGDGASLREKFPEEEKIFLIGGAEVFSSLLAQCDEILLSYIYTPYEGDIKLPSFEEYFRMSEILYQDTDFELRRYLRVGECHV